MLFFNWERPNVRKLAANKDVNGLIKATRHSDKAIRQDAVAALGDIGAMFSDQDPANKGADSLKMLFAAVKRLHKAGFAPRNVDVTVIAERPKIGPHRDAMRESLARVLEIEPEFVSVKGKTNEGMGWIGRGEGLACIAVATITDYP